MGLHFRYRLWIAEMNHEINMLRIFDDYIAEISAKNNEATVVKVIANFNKQFVELRKEIDDLRHEMHLAKMTLAAASREGSIVKTKDLSYKNHVALRKRYLSYRKSFDKIKKDFVQFEGLGQP